MSYVLGTGQVHLGAKVLGAYVLVLGEVVRFI
jgi:hypothetical protein